MHVTLTLRYADDLGTAGETTQTGLYMRDRDGRGEYLHNHRNGRSMT